MQEAAHFESGKQLSADAAVTLRRTQRVDPAGAERELSRVSPSGAWGVSAAEEERPGGGGGPVQHAAIRNQRAALQSR